MCLNAHTPLSEVMGMITTEPSEIDSCIKLLHKFDSKIFNLSDLQKIYGSPLWDQIQIPVNLKKKLEEIIKDFIDSLKISPASFKPIIINLDSVMNLWEGLDDQPINETKNESEPELIQSQSAILFNELLESTNPHFSNFRTRFGRELERLGVEIKLHDDGELKLFMNSNPFSLNLDEFTWALEVLDCTIKHALGVVRVYLCKPGGNHWEYSGIVGIAALVTRASSKHQFSHYINVIDSEGNALDDAVLFEQEFYEGFEYVVNSPFFHTFEVDGYLAGFSFASEAEAAYFHTRVLYCLQNSPSFLANDFYNRFEDFFGTIPHRKNSLIADLTPPREPLTKSVSVMTPRKSSQSEEKEKEVINLLAHPQPLVPDSVASYQNGNDHICDGIALRWRKNPRPMENLVSGSSSPSELAEQVLASQLRLKQLKELWRNAKATGDYEVAKDLLSQIQEQKKEIKKLQDMIGKVHKRRVTLSRRLFQKK